MVILSGEGKVIASSSERPYITLNEAVPDTEDGLYVRLLDPRPTHTHAHTPQGHVTDQLNSNVEHSWDTY